jgi:hypothetical protein
MNEHAAREVLLVQAIETTDAAGALLPSDDGRQAGRTAAEMARWQASQHRVAATDDLFLATRAGLVLDALGPRNASVRALRRMQWRPWLGLALPAAAFVLGALAEQIADRQHVNVLAFPLLLLIAWNIVAYALLLLRPLIGRTLGPLRSWLTGARRLADTAGNAASAAASGRFANDWLALARPLFDARAGRVLHLSAALFAIGALLGLYLRAVAFEYRIGWESTFLSASSVHAFLAVVLGPAAKLVGMPFPTVDAVEAMRMSGGKGGTDAGPWIHLYAVTLSLIVILPRLLLGAWAAWREHRLAADLRLDLGTPYFRRVLAAFTPSTARVRAAPFSYTLGEDAVAGLNALARHLLGETTQLALRSSTQFGEEDAAGNSLPRHEADVALTLAVFNAASTPEHENHGRFLDALRAATEMQLAILVDTAPYRQRLGAQAGTAERMEERCRAWQAFAANRNLPLACVDLSSPDLRRAEAALAPALGSRR